MDKKAIMDKLEKIFQDIFDDKSLYLQETTNANDIEGWDSLTHITILEAVQDEFEVIFSLDEIIELNNAGKIADAIAQKIKLYR